ncbi:MAG TPA: SPFH domain-containing protein [Erysipelotrichaceae bacterium]|nr:SPFH domain-containing protein [Erysipelotrichaceae bacterium]
MGLIKSMAGAVGGTLADQWKEFFMAEALPHDVMMVKGEKVIGRRSSNRRGNDNIISNGSGIVVADGQCMIIVEQGEVVDICAEPGEYTYDTSTEPSIFTGKLSESVKETFKTIGKRFTYGGDTAKDQRVYYINTKELIDNKFGTQNPIPFRVVDNNIGLDIDVGVRCSGIYSYRIDDPILFYTNVSGNVSNHYLRDELDGQLKTEFVSALQPAFAKISQLGVRPSALPGYVDELSSAMNEALSEKWSQLRGLKVVSIGLNPITLPEEDAELIKQAQKSGMLRDPGMAAATIVGAQADAMRAAASNEGGALTGLMGLGMAQQAGGVDATALFDKASQQQSTQASWTCECGTANTGKFCTECGKERKTQGFCPNCGHQLQEDSKFCTNCGHKLGE